MRIPNAYLMVLDYVYLKDAIKTAIFEQGLGLFDVYLGFSFKVILSANTFLYFVTLK